MISSLQNPLVKQLRKLHRAKERHRQGCFLIEGTHLLEEACSASWPLQVVCHTAAWQRSSPKLWERATQQAQRVELVDEAVLEAIATTAHPDGVVAAAQRQPPVQPSAPFSLGLAVETLQDPGNLGTIIRTAAAAGVDGVWLSEDSVDIEHPKVLRASAGQWFRLPMARRATWREDIAQLRTQLQGLQIVATCPTAPLTFWQVDFTQPTLVLVGNEGAGLSAAALALADLQVSIPAAANVESLNAAVATALILYEAVRQRSLAAL